MAVYKYCVGNDGDAANNENETNNCSQWGGVFLEEIYNRGHGYVRCKILQSASVSLTIMRQVFHYCSIFLKPNLVFMKFFLMVE